MYPAVPRTRPAPVCGVVSRCVTPAYRVWTLDQLRKPEVEDLRTALGSHEDVVRLQIAVNDAFGMCSRETKRDLCGEVRRFAKRKGPLPQHRCQRLAFEQFRHDVRDAAVHANVEHRHDVRVVECGRYPRLLFETPQTVGALGKRRRQHFHGDTAVQARVERAVDLAHATCAEGLADFVGAQPRAGRDSHGVIIATRSSPTPRAFARLGQRTEAPPDRDSGFTCQLRRMADSSSALIAFLNRAPGWPLTRRSHSAHVACRIGVPPTRLRYEYAERADAPPPADAGRRLGTVVSSGRSKIATP